MAAIFFSCREKLRIWFFVETKIKNVVKTLNGCSWPSWPQAIGCRFTQKYGYGVLFITILETIFKTWIVQRPWFLTYKCQKYYISTTKISISILFFRSCWNWCRWIRSLDNCFPKAVDDRLCNFQYSNIDNFVG